MNTTKLKVARNDYLKIGIKALMSKGVPESDANIQMDALLECDLRGIHTHGIFRLPRYLHQLEHNYINSKPQIRKIKESPLIDVVDGDHGLGAVVSHLAMKEAVNKSLNLGVGIVGCRNSNHFGAAAYYAEMAAQQNQIGIVLTNASPSIAPTGSLKPLLGNNPWSISVPMKNGRFITLDIANSVVARGKLRVAIQNGESIPEGWALDKRGLPTTNPEEALKGIVLPVGGYKGYGITLMLEILSGILTGADFGEKMVGLDADAVRNVGHLFISIGVERFMELEEFYNRLEEFAQSIKQAPRIDENQEIFLPGEIEYRQRDSQDKDSVLLPDRVFQVVTNLSDEYSVAFNK